LISASRTIFSQYNLKILRAKVIKNLKNFPKKFCESRSRALKMSCRINISKICFVLCKEYLFKDYTCKNTCVITRLRIVMHLKSVKYACKYALKTAKICTKNCKNMHWKHKNMHLKTPKHLQQTSKLLKIRAYLQNCQTFFLQNVHAKKSFPDLLNS